MKKLSKTEIIKIVLQSDCAFQPDTVYRRMQRQGMTLEEAMTLPARARVATKRFYVYYLLEAGIVFYVGSGQGDRAYRHWVKPYIDAETKVAKWIKTTLPEKPTVQIVKDNLSEQDACELECTLIRDLNPACNYIGSMKYEIWGEKFASLKEVANDPRCKCSWPLLKKRMNWGWGLEESVGPLRHQATNPYQNRGPDGKFAP